MDGAKKRERERGRDRQRFKCFSIRERDGDFIKAEIPANSLERKRKRVRGDCGRRPVSQSGGPTRENELYRRSCTSFRRGNLCVRCESRRRRERTGRERRERERRRLRRTRPKKRNKGMMSKVKPRKTARGTQPRRRKSVSTTRGMRWRSGVE